MANLNTWIYEDHGCNRDYANAPLRYENPKGFVDCWRTPKYYYYLWQAVYAEKPMVFIHPHFWRSPYLGQKKEIVVDSNCDSVELKVNGRSVGVLKPRFEEANVLRFRDVTVEKGVLTAEGHKGTQLVTTQVVMAGPPARLVVTANPCTLEAGLDSLALVRADIVDAEGNHVYGATGPLQWSVTGPARLVGPPAYTTDTDKCQAAEGTMYIDAPAFNIIRSTGKPGQIKVRLRSPGLAPAEVLLSAAAPPPSPSLAILQPPLSEGNRRSVAREGGSSHSNDASPQEMKNVSEDLVLKASGLDGYRAQIEGFLREKNAGLDLQSPECHAMVSVFARLFDNNHGSLARDDFNFTVGSYNDCRRITRQVDGLPLPAIFKHSLREYYARTMLEQGEAKDYTTETRWLTSLPRGQVVVAEAAGAAREPGVLYVERPELDAMVAAAAPEFKALPDGRKPALLDAICSFNPNIKRRVVKSGGRKVDGVRQKTTQSLSYEIGPGQPILVPSLKDLERLNRKQSQQQADPAETNLQAETTP
jgi:hypothetical protein